MPLKFFWKKEFLQKQQYKMIILLKLVSVSSSEMQ